MASGLVLGCSDGDLPPTIRVPGGDADRGATLIYQYGCGTCHVIPGVSGANAQVGPPLTDWAARQYIVGAVPNLPEYLIAFIMNPDTIEPGTGMPDLGVSEEEARHMAAYLYTIGKREDVNAPHLLPPEWLEPGTRRTGRGAGNP